MAAERNAFNIHLGDTIYSDTEVNSTGSMPRPARGAHREAEVGQVQAQPRQPLPARAARRGRLLLALGRPRVRERLLAPGEHLRPVGGPARCEHQRRGALSPRGAGLPRLLAGHLFAPRAASTAASAGAPTSRSSSSTSAPSATPRPTRQGSATTRRPAARLGSHGAPVHAQRVRRRLPAAASASPSRPPAWRRIRDPNRDYLGDSQYNRFTKAIAAPRRASR